MLREEINKIQPFDSIEREHWEDAIRWIDSGVAVCRIEKPATPPKHLVSYFVLTDGEYVLLVDHKKAGLWLPSGGHVEPGEHPKDTASREALEELKIEANFVFDQPLMITRAETVGNTAGHTDVSLWYVLQGDRSHKLEFDKEEFNDIKWFHHKDIPFSRSDPNMERFILKWTQKRIQI